MSLKRIARGTLTLLTLGVLLLLLLLLVNPVQARQRPALLEMSVIAREADGSAWANARRGMEQAAADLHVELRFLYPSDSNNSLEQCQLLRRETESGASAILLFPTDRAALAETVQDTAGQAALVTLETDMTAQGARGCVGADNTALGQALGTAALNGVPPGETVLLLDSAPGDNGIRERMEAAGALLEAAGRTVLYCRPAEGESLAAALQSGLAQGDVCAVVAFEPSALERAAAETALLDEPPLLYGAGSTAAIAANLEQGRITSIVAQNAFSTGYLAVEAAAGLARREPAEPLVQLPCFTVRRENMYEPDYQKLLFPVTR